MSPSAIPKKGASADQVAVAVLLAGHLVVLRGYVEALNAKLASLGDARDAPVVLAAPSESMCGLMMAASGSQRPRRRHQPIPAF